MESNRQAPDANSQDEDVATRIERALAALRRGRRGGRPGRDGGERGPGPFGSPGGPFPGGPFGTGGFGTGGFPPFGRRPEQSGGPEGDQHDHGPFGGRHPHWHRGDAGPGGFARFRALEALETGPRTVTELAELIGVDQPRASRLVSFGVKAGLLRKAPDPSDARRAIVELTDAGREAMAAARSRRRSSLDRALASFTPEEADQFASFLERFAAGFTAPGDTPA